MFSRLCRLSTQASSLLASRTAQSRTAANMPSSIPNDIYQSSLFSAHKAGLKSGGPPVAFLTNHGTHGTGYFESVSSTARPHDMIQLDSIAYTIGKDGTAKPAERGACMPHTSVVVFQPTYRLKPTPGTTSSKIKEEVFNMGRNTPMSFRVEGAFKSVTTEQKSYESVKGTIFGFVIPSWQEEVSGEGLVCCFLSEDKKTGGRVKEFETGEAAEVDWAKCGRFHLGFPQDDEYEELKI
jgi:alpha-acetolactate decarboxylase